MRSDYRKNIIKPHIRYFEKSVNTHSKFLVFTICMSRLIHSNNIFDRCIVLNLMGRGKMVTSGFHHDFKCVYTYFFSFFFCAISERPCRGDASAEIQSSSEFFDQIRWAHICCFRLQGIDAAYSDFYKIFICLDTHCWL